jgi:hypothetical protein
MKRRLILIACVVLAPRLFAQLEDVVYDRYRSGAPRLVIRATEEPDEVLLVRMPGNHILDRKPLDDRAVEITIQRILDPKDVVVEMTAPHTPGANIYRVRGNKLVFIGQPSVYWGLIVADLDHDGTPELITTGCCDPTPCGVMIGAGIERFDGKMYVDDGRNYVHYATADAAGGTGEFAIKDKGAYIVHIYRDRDVASARVTIDHEVVADGERVKLEKDCHTITLEVRGEKDASIHVFIEKP